VPAADSGGAALGLHGAHGQRNFSASDMGGALDDAVTSSSVSALHDELAEKNKIIERLQVGWVVSRAMQLPCSKCRLRISWDV
jgi:hypothetical protein